MKNMAKSKKSGLSTLQKWNAAIRCSPDYDGIFFYAVITTGIFCRPSCKSKTPVRENVLFFDTAEQANVAGFRPCKRCRPDLFEYKPAKETAEKAKELVESIFNDKRELYKKLNGLGLTIHRLTEIFKEYYGISPAEYISCLRFDEAKYLLSETNDSITDIAYSVGFGSLGAFYSFWGSRMRLSPAVYRKKNKKINKS